ncbi:hypothetical protein NQD34_013483 [Periophthalmus magnuspinnatus]|nr:hypothetical protein NQD34_013483 [Periophthalmus magnuspinnatus]
MEHPFFEEELGVKVELAEDDDGQKVALKLLLKMEGNRKLHGKYKNNNAIEFLFDMNKDSPELVAQDMVILGFVSEADYKLVAKAIRYRVSAIKRQRDKMQRLADDDASLLESTNQKSESPQSPPSTPVTQDMPSVPWLQAPPTGSNLSPLDSGISSLSSRTNVEEERQPSSIASTASIASTESGSSVSSGLSSIAEATPSPVSNPASPSQSPASQSVNPASPVSNPAPSSQMPTPPASPGPFILNLASPPKNTTSYLYNPASPLLNQSPPSRHTTSLSYNPANQAPPSRNTTSLTYNSDDQIPNPASPQLKSPPPIRNSTSLTYNPANQIINLAPPPMNSPPPIRSSTPLTYNPANQIINLASPPMSSPPSRNSTSLTYNLANQITNPTPPPINSPSPVRSSTSLTYNPANQITNPTPPPINSPTPVRSSTSLTYNPANQIPNSAPPLALVSPVPQIDPASLLVNSAPPIINPAPIYPPFLALFPPIKRTSKPPPLPVLRYPKSIAVSQIPKQVRGSVSEFSSPVDSSASDVMSGMSDRDDSQSEHSIQMNRRAQAKAFQKRARLRITSLSERVVECQLFTHDNKVVTFKFDLDADNPEDIASVMIHRDFILKPERDAFIDRMYDIIKRAESMNQPSPLQEARPTLPLHLQAEARSRSHSSSSLPEMADSAPAPMGGDFYVDREATPPVRSLRSQSFHTSSASSPPQPPAPFPYQFLPQSPTPPIPQAAPSHWPHPDEPIFSLSNVLSLAMSVAQTWMPPPPTPPPPPPPPPRYASPPTPTMSMPPHQHPSYSQLPPGASGASPGASGHAPPTPGQPLSPALQSNFTSTPASSGSNPGSDATTTNKPLISPPPSPSQRLSPRLSPIQEVKKPEFKVGRFQVSLSKDNDNRQLTQPTPTRHSPPPRHLTQSESSSETSSSSSSGHSQVGVASRTNLDRDDEDSEEGHSGNGQSHFSRHETDLSSDESESENEDDGVWAALRELQDKHLAQVQELQANQKREIEQLYVRMGKAAPAGIMVPEAILNQRQRRLSKTGPYPGSNRHNSLQRLEHTLPAGIMRKSSVSGSSSGSQERVKGVTFALDPTTMDT